LRNIRRKAIIKYFVIYYLLVAKLIMYSYAYTFYAIYFALLHP